MVSISISGQVHHIAFSRDFRRYNNSANNALASGAFEYGFWMIVAQKKTFVLWWIDSAVVSAMRKWSIKQCLNCRAATEINCKHLLMLDTVKRFALTQFVHIRRSMERKQSCFLFCSIHRDHWNVHLPLFFTIYFYFVLLFFYRRHMSGVCALALLIRMYFKWFILRHTFVWQKPCGRSKANVIYTCILWNYDYYISHFCFLFAFPFLSNRTDSNFNDFNNVIAIW